MLNEINFIYDWEKEGTNKKYCWSGTPYGIYQSLSDIIKVNEYVVSYSILQSGMIFLQRIFNRFTHTNDFYILKTKLGQKNIDSKMKLNMSVPNLMFLEYNSKVISDTYIFQDLSVDFVFRFTSQNPEMRKYIGCIPEGTTDSKIRERVYMTKSFYQNCKGIFTMSEWLKNDLIKNTGILQDKIHCVGGGCNIDITKIHNINKNGKRFLFVGKNFYCKNGPLVVDAFSKLYHIYPDIELYIVGPQNIPPEIISKPGIYFIGRVSYNELVKYYNLCDYFVMPSKFEPYGLVFGEALIFGLPCIGKNIFAMPEFISQGVNGYLIDSDKVDELYIVMKKLLLEGEKIKMYVAENRKNYRERYSWKNVAKRMVQVFEKDGY